MKDKFLYNNRVFKDRRKELRNNQTEAELQLWTNLKSKKLGGLKFQRQYSTGPYILDFYCPKSRLAVELDGNRHNEEEAVIYDKERTKYLDSLNIKTIRFWNDEVLKNLKGVLGQIYNEAVKGGV